MPERPHDRSRRHGPARRHRVQERTTRRAPADPAAIAAALLPRDDLVAEREVAPGVFEAREGPVRHYRRTVVVSDDGAGGATLTQTLEYRLAVPYFAWLFRLPFRRALSRPPRARPPWWAPPARLDARAATVLGLLAALAVVFGYLNTLFSQTVAFAAEQFSASNTAQGVAGGVVRGGGLVALAVAAGADRVGRRPVILATAWSAVVATATGALAPSLAGLAASQVVARGLGTALLLLVGIVAAEEVPAGTRAYAVSLLAMAGGVGAGGAVLALPLAELGPGAWRILYLLPLAAAPGLLHVGRHLPESRRYAVARRAPASATTRSRLLLLAVSGLLTSLFVAPQSQFNNRFLRTERGFSAPRISLLTIVSGLPGSVGIVLGGRIADVRGRRVVAAVALVGGTLATVAYFASRGWPLWVWPTVGTALSAAAIPALGVYGPELFPTARRGRANGLVAVCGLVGSAAGLLAAGALSDRLGSLAPAMAILGVGPLLVAALVVLAYPETAGQELEALNPEDRAAPGP